MVDARDLDLAYRRLGEHLRLVEMMKRSADEGDSSITAAVVEATCNAAASAATALAEDFDITKSAYRMRVSNRDPRNWPRVPRLPDDAGFVSVGPLA